MRARCLLPVALLLVTACGDDDDSASPTTSAAVETTTTAAAETTTTAEATTTTTAPAEPFTILVTNDDGVGAPGIDALVEGLRADPTIEVVVVAPLENQSGAGDATTEGAVASEAQTISGYPAVAVAGKPADSVNHALDVVFAGTEPDLVMSGINAGQNLGPVVDLSGTVGAARTAARRGIPAVAISQGFPGEGVEFDYPSAVEAALTWLEANRDALEDGDVVNINVPTCDPGSAIHDTVELPSDTTSDQALALQVADCASTIADPTGEVEAFNAGFVTVTEPGLG